MLSDGIYNPFIELSKVFINSKHSILYFRKEDTVSQKNKIQGTLPTYMLSYLVNIYILAPYIYG